MNGEMVNSTRPFKFRWDNIPVELKCPKNEEWLIRDNEVLIYNESNGRGKNEFTIRQKIIKYAKVHKMNLAEASRAVLAEMRKKKQAK